MFFRTRPGHQLAGKAEVHPEETLAFPFAECTRILPRALQPMLAARLPRTSRQPGRPLPAIECKGPAIAKLLMTESHAIGPFTLPTWNHAHYAKLSLKGPALTETARRFRACLHEAEAALAREEARLVSKLLPARAPAEREMSAR